LNQVIAIRKRLSGQKGFTLIELLVVVAILGILATVAVPRVMDAIDNARAKKAIADMTVIRDGLERFYLDYGVFPPGLQALVSENYLDPNTKFTNAYGKLYFYMVFRSDAVVTNLKDYRLGDPGINPGALGTPPLNQAALNALTALPPGCALGGADAYAWWSATTPLALGEFTSAMDPAKIFHADLYTTVTQITAVPVPTGTNIVWAYQGK
jgi:type II secretion system protein G